MKIAVCSDLHLEFDLFKPDVPIFQNKEQADVLILGGDILVASHIKPNATYGKGIEAHRKFFEMCSNNYKDVIYLMGNHEHYNGDFKHTPGIVFQLLCEFDNIHFLEKESVTINDTLFVGGTMWTDFNKEDPLTMFTIEKRMNDFRCVTNSNDMVGYRVPLYKDKDVLDDEDYSVKSNAQDIIGYKVKERPVRFSPDHALEDHKKFLTFLKNQLENNPIQKTVVCTHHTPSFMSCHPKYADDREMNGGYHSDLTKLILENRQIKLWTHGHTHELFDYMIGSTRVVCNPRGYEGYEDIAETFALKVVEV